MSLLGSIPFTTASNYLFDNTKIEVFGGVARLKLKQEALVFDQDFSSDSGFIFDNTRSEFVAGVLRQIDQLIADNTFGVNFSNVNADANWLVGTLTATLNNSAAVVAGKLNLIGVGKNVEYVGTGKINALKGSLKFIFTPDYSGNPGANQTIFHFANSSGSNNNLTKFSMDTAKAWRFDAFSTAGVTTIQNQGLGSSTLVSGVPVEIEFNYDFTVASEFQNIFVDGVLIATSNRSCARVDETSAITYLRFGDDTLVNDFSIDDIIIAVVTRHTVGYTPGYTVPDAKFLADIINLPQFVNSGLGNIISIVSVFISDTNAPLYTLKGVEHQYWNGSAWVSSNETPAQASTAVDIIANIDTWTDANGINTIDINCYTVDNNFLQTNFNNFRINFIGETTYPTDNPFIKTNTVFNADQVLDFLDSIVESGLDTVTHSQEADLLEMYWNGSAWVASVGFPQTNTASDINANIETLSLVSKYRPITYLHSENGLTTPSITLIEFNYNFNPPPVTIETLDVIGYMFRPNGTPDVGAIVKAAPVDFSISDNNVQINISPVETVVSDTVDGSWVLSLVPSNLIRDNRYDFTFISSTGRIIRLTRAVIGVSPVDFDDLI